jgi:bacteriorhodopsin
MTYSNFSFMVGWLCVCVSLVTLVCLMLLLAAHLNSEIDQQYVYLEEAYVHRISDFNMFAC